MVTTEQLRELASLPADKGLVISFYLNVDRRDRSPIRYAEVAHQLVREAGAHVADPAMPHAVARQLQADLDRIVRYVGAEFRHDHARGLAVFASGARGLWRTFDLPSPLQDLVRVGRTAYLRPLAAAMTDYPRAGVVLVDRGKARLFVVEMGAIEELEPVVDDVPGRIRAESWYGLSDSKIERHVDEQIFRHLKHVAAAAENMAHARRLGRILLGGAADVVAAQTRALSADMQSRVAGRVEHLTMLASREEVLARTREALAAVVEAEREGLVSEMAENAGPGGRAAIGAEETLAAMYHRAVRTLVLDRGSEAAGWRCCGCGRLFRMAGPCPECGGQAECACDLGEAAFEEALRQDAGFAILDRTPAIKPWDGMAALLRFPASTHQAELPRALVEWG